MNWFLSSCRFALYHVGNLSKTIGSDACEWEKAVLPTVNGRRGHPALIRMDLLADILAYEGSAGGGGLRGFWKQLGDAMMELPVDDRGCIMDTDTKEQLQEAENYMRY